MNQEKQNQLRQEALDFQFMSNDKDLSYSEIAEIQGYFYKKGKALGLYNSLAFPPVGKVAAQAVG